MALLDTGADCDLVSSSFVASLEKSQLTQRFPIPPFPVGSVSEKVVQHITHAVTLPVRMGETFFLRNFGIMPLGNPPDIILGLPWFQDFCPEVIKFLQKFDQPTMLSRDQAIPVYQIPATPEQAPIPCPPSTNPQDAFSAGGVTAAIEAEIARRDTATQQAKSIMVALIHVNQALQDKKADAGVRGLTGNQEGWLETIPLGYRHFAHTVFSDESAAHLPPHREGVDCEIKIREGEKLRTSKYYQMSTEELSTLKQLLDAEVQKGFIRKSNSESSAPVFFVRDPPSESRNQGQLRLVVDYRDLNKKIILDEYPIPLTRIVMQRLAKAKIFTKFDVRSGFANIRMKPGSEAATAFKTFFGLFEYQVMPMGLATAPAVFQRFINQVLSPFLDIFCFAYLDDIIIFSENEQDHQKHVTQVLETLQAHQLHLKPSKCAWFKQEVSFLGFTAVAGKGVRMSDDKIQALRDTPAPTCLSELRSFLGLINFYDQFIPHFSDITAPLTNLTKKDTPWLWSEACQASFRRLLDSIRDDVFLQGFDPARPLTLETDASDVAYAGCISQPDDNGNLRPLIFFHHKFKEHEKGWDIADKELYPIVYAFDHYRHFLSQPAFPVEVFSDHRNLAKFMLTSDLMKSHDGRLARWWQKLSESNFTIQYRTGAENVVADFLSRYGFPDSSDLTAHRLLPRARFSNKALTDIDQWFKKAGTPNIRSRIESDLAKIRMAPVVPVPQFRISAEAINRKPLFRCLKGYSGPSFDIAQADPRHIRTNGNRQGLGYVPDDGKTA